MARNSGGGGGNQTQPSDFLAIGIDGNSVDSNLYQIPLSSYKQIDLTNDFNHSISQIKSHFNLADSYKFDLVESLEVAEHLKESSALNFVKLLCNLGDIVLFSAAIPMQGGTEHINEQPPKFWSDLFLQNNFVCIDKLRFMIWDDKDIECWYRQNILLFVAEHRLDFFTNQGISSTINPLHLVHYELFQLYRNAQTTANHKKRKRLFNFFKNKA